MLLAFTVCLALWFFAADISVVICDINLKVKNLLSRHKETPSLKTIVVMEEVSKENQDTAKELNVEIIQYSKLEVSLMSNR